ncbi:hypothetical protein [Vibrio sp. 10N.261.55.A7]|uniref:NfrA family protein n=1 Tax=Vibrio sp. 10N.261.55.A7 TaxID=1880851 RepID=UPI000CA6A99D|nr:hypothetical protein [Vibrio sp. 10N.261.55.A7]PMJ90746.1 hypothetical protein BCU12_11430 [Vibrio sp. 10N.261.55.A7]
MKTSVLKRVLFLTLIVFCSSVSAADTSSDIFSGMSDTTRFRAFPYVDKAYRYEAESNYREALEEIQKARDLAPEHSPFMRYAYQLGVKAGIHDSELEDFVVQLPEQERSELLLNLRTTRSERAELLLPHEFRTLSEGMTGGDTKEWFVRHLYAIEKKHGPEVALKWSDSQSSRDKTSQVFRYEAYEWFDQKQFQKVIPLIEKIDALGVSSETDKRYLITSLVKLGNVEKAEQVVMSSNSKELEVHYLRSYSSILVDKKQLEQAKIQLLKLRETTKLTSSEKKQLAYINSLNKEQLRMVRTQGVVFSQCLQNVIAQHNQGSRDEAKALFNQCDPLNSPEAWINVGQQVADYQTLASYQFKRNGLEKKRKRVLTDHYIRESDWVSIIELHENSQYEDDQKALANAYSELGRYELATQVWLNLYRNKQNLQYVDSAAYNSALAGDFATEAKAYHLALALQPSDAANDKAFLTRAYSLAFKDVTLFSLSDIALLASFNLESTIIDPKIWLVQGQCEHCLKSSEPRISPFLGKSEAYCLGKTEPLLAVRKYLSSMTTRENNDFLVMAQWSYEGGDFLSAKNYWELVEESSLTAYEKFRYVDTLREMSLYQTANDKWSKFAISSEPEWWRLGIELADSLGDQELSKTRTITALKETYSSVFVRKLATRYIATDNIHALSELSDYVLEVDDKGNMSAELGYLTSDILPHKSEKLFEKAVAWPPYDSDTALIAQWAYVADKNGNIAQSRDIYRHAIDHVDMSSDDINYMQTSHRDLSLGWKFTVAGWIGKSQGALAPGYSARTGDFFLYEEAKYYFDQPAVPGLAISIAGLHSGQYDSDIESWSSDEIDVGAQFQPLENWSYFLKFGVKQGLNSDNNETKPYLRLSADVFSNDDWTPAWKRDADSWLYHKLYVDGIYYIDEDDDYSLYARYDLGRVFKMYDEHRQRLISYGFSQWGNSQENKTKYEDSRLGLGVAWGWEWNEDQYDGLSVYSEIGIEWQHIIDNTNYNGNGDAFLLRFAAYF